MSGQYFSEPKQVKVKNGLVVTFRRPEIADAERILEYLDVIFGESDNLLFGAGEFSMSVAEEEKYIENANNSKGSLLLLGVVGDEIVSIANIDSSKQKKIAHNAEIGISVRKSHWGIGIGSAMMSELIEFAKHHGIKNVRLGVKADNANAIKLYEKCGFAKIGVQKDFFHVGDNYYDEILMVLHI